MKVTKHPDGRITVDAPHTGDIIDVYHPDRGGVRMVVTGRFRNTLECEFEGIEYSVMLKQVTFSDEEPGYRWEAEKQ